MTIIAGGIDLSIPAVIGLSDIIVTQLYNDNWPLPVIFLGIAALPSSSARSARWARCCWSTR